MKNTPWIPLLENVRTTAGVRKIVDATHTACRDLIRTNGDRKTWMDPDAGETILGLIRIWGIPVLDANRLDAERTWLWADIHLRDAASVRVHRRPFWCRATHDRALKRRWRRAIGPTDLTIHAGDFAPESMGERSRRTLLNTLPGRKINILGNHDVAMIHAPLEDGWDATFGALVIASDPPLVVTHCPLRKVPPGAINVHGHMHRRRDRRNDRHINVAVEQTGYHPVRASALIAEAARRLAGEVPRPLYTGTSAAPAAPRAPRA